MRLELICLHIDCNYTLYVYTHVFESLIEFCGAQLFVSNPHNNNNYHNNNRPI